jgi:D-serine deaminase-like pyridoxal phosphate-dependent protein
MSPWPAARVGDPIQAIDTPALLLDLDAFEANLGRMMAAVQGSKVRLRPHAKSHKCVEIARRQVAIGAVGICCQKVSEAAVFARAGIADILVTNQVVGEAKIRHLVELARMARIGVLVDHPAQVAALLAATRAQQASLDVYVEVDVGSHRCGVAPTDAGTLAQRIVQSPPLRFAGLHCYHGAAQHLRSPGEREAAIAKAAQATREARRQVEQLGIRVAVVTGAGTGTFIHERDSGEFDEIQPGSYIFMDADYRANQAAPADVPFEQALFVLSTVLSRPDRAQAVLDAGLKASSVDSGMPQVWQRPGLRYLKASDEHGVVVGNGVTSLELGEKLLLVPGHCDPTVNLYDQLICVRQDVVESIWPIEARGALL